LGNDDVVCAVVASVTDEDARGSLVAVVVEEFGPLLEIIMPPL
jgi:hypothetical protein